MEYIIDFTVLELPHTLVGAAIGAKVAHPALAIPLAFGSHFLLDRIPHWNPHLNTELKQNGMISNLSTSIVTVDSLLALVGGIMVASQFPFDSSKFTLVLLCAFAGVLPDVVEAPYFFLGYKNKWIVRWLEFQKSIQSDSDLKFGLLTQLVTVAASIAVAYS